MRMLKESLLTLSEAARRLPGRPHLSTVWRWATRGVGPRRTRLDTVRIGGRRYTSAQALSRFVAAISSDATESAMSSTDDGTAEAADREMSHEWPSSAQQKAS